MMDNKLKRPARRGFRPWTGPSWATQGLVRGIALQERTGLPIDLVTNERAVLSGGSAVWAPSTSGTSFSHNSANSFQFANIDVHDFMLTEPWTIVSWQITRADFGSLGTQPYAWTIRDGGGDNTQLIYRRFGGARLFIDGQFVGVNIGSGDITPLAGHLTQFVCRYNGTDAFIDFYNATKQLSLANSFTRPMAGTIQAFGIGAQLSGGNVGLLDTVQARIYRGFWSEQQIIQDRKDPWAWLGRPSVFGRVPAAPPTGNPLLGGLAMLGHGL